MTPTEKAEACRVEIERLRKKHRAFGCYDECGHEHQDGDPGIVEVWDIGYSCKEGLRYEVCFGCHTDDGEVCDWTPEEQHWPCDAARLLDYAEAMLDWAGDYIGTQTSDPDAREIVEAYRYCSEEAVDKLYQFLGLKE